MAKERSGSEERVRRSVARTLANGSLLLLLVAALAVWGWTGFYQLVPGQAAVVLRLGAYQRTVSEDGLNWHLPPPLETRVVTNVSAIEREEFGYPGDAPPVDDRRAILEAAMQTRDNNIVHASFAIQYRIKDPLLARFRIANRQEILRDAAQAAVREVVGRRSIDGVLSQERAVVQAEAETVLQTLLDRYESGLEIRAVQLLGVQPPPEVREAFDDVISADQDRNRAINEAEGYANEVLPKARAQAIELRESARAYREARVAEATGEASRFVALAREYEKAPEVTRTRLFFETMEKVLPHARKVIVEPGTGVLPHFPLIGSQAPPPPVAAPPSGGAR